MENQRLKLLQADYAEAIPLSPMKREQLRISGEIADAARRLERVDTALTRASREIGMTIELA